MLKNSITGEMYIFNRPSSELESVVNQFQDDFLMECKRLTPTQRKLFAADLLRLIRLFKQPTKNHEIISDLKEEFTTNFPIPKYFYYSTLHNQKAEHLTIIPELFLDLACFGRFLYMAELVVWIQLHAPKTDKESKPKGTVRVRAIAYAIKFQLESHGKNGRTLNEYFHDWTDKISKEYQPRTTRSIEQAYHRLEDSNIYRDKFKSDIIQAISLLKGDYKAIQKGEAYLKRIND